MRSFPLFFCPPGGGGELNPFMLDVCWRSALSLPGENGLLMPRFLRFPSSPSAPRGTIDAASALACPFAIIASICLMLAAQPACLSLSCCREANAWEEGDEVVLITCRLENPDLDMVNGAVKDKLENFTNQLYEMRFNMKTGAASQKQLSAPAVDFPRINENFTGRKQRYVYGTILDSIAKVKGIVKFDLHAEPEAGKKQLEVGGNVLGIFDLGPGRFGSEAVFVPRRPGTTFEEDDGYLIFFAHDDTTGISEVKVIDAKTMSPEPVAVVELPCRVPYGFHAFFVSEEQLQQQKTEV